MWISEEFRNTLLLEWNTGVRVLESKTIDLTIFILFLFYFYFRNLELELI